MDQIERWIVNQRKGMASEKAVYISGLNAILKQDALPDCTKSSRVIVAERPDSLTKPSPVETILLYVEDIVGKEEKRFEAIWVTAGHNRKGEQLGSVDEVKEKKASDELEVAQWLGREFLHLSPESVLDAELTVAPKESRKCTPTGQQDPCVSINDTAILALTIRDTQWLRAKDAQATLHAQCNTADQESMQKLLAERSQKLQAGSPDKALGWTEELETGRSLSVQVPFQARGSCSFLAVLSHSSYRREISTARPLEVRALPLLVKVYSPDPLKSLRLRSVSAVELQVEQHKLGPWIKRGTSISSKDGGLRKLRVLSGEDVVQFGARVRSAILDTSNANSAFAHLQNSLDELLDQPADAMGYALLRDSTRLCGDIALKLMAKNRSGMSTDDVSRWQEGCSRQLDKVMQELAQQVKGSPQPVFQVQPVPGEPDMARRLLLDIPDSKGLEMTAEEFRATEKIDGRHPSMEKYQLFGRSGSGLLSLPLQLNVTGEPGVANLELSLFLQGQPPPSAQRSLGIGLNLGVPLLDRLLLVDVAGDLSFFLNSTEDSPLSLGLAAMAGIDLVHATTVAIHLISQRSLLVAKRQPALLFGIGYDLARRDRMFYVAFNPRKDSTFDWRVLFSSTGLQLRLALTFTSVD
jgi:hypothetical protein